MPASGARQVPRTIPLEQDSTSYLWDDAGAAAAAGNLAVGALLIALDGPPRLVRLKTFWTSLRSWRRVRVDREVLEERGVDVSVPGYVELRRTLIARAGPEGQFPGSRHRLLACNKPTYRTISFSLHGARPVGKRVWNFTGNDAGTIVAKAREIVIDARSHRKRLTTVCRPDAGDRPSVQRGPDEAIERHRSNPASRQRTSSSCGGGPGRNADGTQAAESSGQQTCRSEPPVLSSVLLCSVLLQL